MGVFKEICELRELSGRASVLYVKQRLTQAISMGWVEQVPVMKPNRFHPDEEWYRDKETGEIYSLIPGDERGGYWDRVDLSDLIDPNEGALIRVPVIVETSRK